jgi:hypothetical protein
MPRREIARSAPAIASLPARAPSAEQAAHDARMLLVWAAWARGSGDLEAEIVHSAQRRLTHPPLNEAVATLFERAARVMADHANRGGS